MKRILSEPIIFVLKIVLTLLVVVVGFYFFKKFLPASILDRIWKEEKGKKIVDDLKKTESNVGTRRGTLCYGISVSPS